MTLIQDEFDFMKQPEETPVGFEHEYTSVCITNGWYGKRVTPKEEVDDGTQVFAFIKYNARKYPGFHLGAWTFTDIPEKKCIVVDFGSHRYFGRVDYV